MTRREAAIVSAYTGIMLGSFAALHEYVEEKFGRPVQSLEFAFNKDEVKAAAREDFLAICAEVDPQ